MNQRKTRILKLRVTEEELSALRRRAKTYRTMSAMLRAALSQLDDRRANDRFAAMDALYLLHRNHDAQLAHVGNNLNQAVHRLHALALEGNINADMIRSSLIPKVDDTYSLLCHIKEYLDRLASSVITPDL